MTTQKTMFALHAEPLAAPVRKIESEGERLKREGMRIAAMPKESQLGYARELAVEIALAGDGTCHADLVAAALEKEGRPPLGDAAGSLWLKHVWEFSGRYHLSERPASHRNRLMVWRLKIR